MINAFKRIKAGPKKKKPKKQHTLLSRLGFSFLFVSGFSPEFRLHSYYQAEETHIGFFYLNMTQIWGSHKYFLFCWRWHGWLYFRPTMSNHTARIRSLVHVLGVYRERSRSQFSSASECSLIIQHLSTRWRGWRLWETWSQPLHLFCSRSSISGPTLIHSCISVLSDNELVNISCR